MPVPTDLKHFEPSEFKFPDLMDTTFLRWLDRVRELSGVPMIVTNDARPAGEMPTGASAKSLHRRGRAVDIRSRTLTAAQKWNLVQAMVDLRDEAPGKIEFECVFSPTDTHWHIAVDDSPTASHEMVEADE